NNARHILVSNPSLKEPLDILTPKGKGRVLESAKELKKMGGVDIILASPLGRTRETAEIMAKELGVKVQYEPLLKEINVGVYEGKTEKEYGDYFEGEEGYNFVKAVPQGENLSEVRTRMLNVIHSLENKYEGKKIVIVSHGHPLWLLETALLGLTTSESVEWKEKNYPETGKVKIVKYSRFPYNTEGELDFHRPFVDEIEFHCSKCKKGKMRRVEDLIDVWFDSGSMPFAQTHWPFSASGGKNQKLAYPGDYIAEGIDQTRGWFYTLLAVSAIMGKAPSYRNVISLGIVLDEKGHKMSKSKGNIVNPMELSSKYGMDALRWYFFTVNQPGDSKLFAERDVKDRWQRFISTLANSHTFFETYAPDVKPPSVFKSENILDKWVFIRLKQVSKTVSTHLDNYNILDAARAVDDFVLEDLSNWYIRRSRERLQRPKSKTEKTEAAKTLAFVLNETVKIAAPFIPFLSEHIWQSINKTHASSVHWEDYPAFNKLSAADEKTLKIMQDIRDWAQVGLRLRKVANIKVRQPLESFAVPKDIPPAYKDILKDEINVKEIVDISKAGANKDDWVYDEESKGKMALKTKLSESLVMEGQVREMMRHIQDMRKSLGLHPNDAIEIYYSMPENLRDKLVKFETKIASDTNAVFMKEKELGQGTYDAKADFNWEGKLAVSVAINKR
ncbi:MAG: class I tRNA ligase family protein, partial [Candidatus Spechtbacteria bacterium]|nr:class I tRNA ligase family protein [Candidatus Spechtbacteria bacterium]